MTAHRALIVDDSKTARIRLRNMLSRYQLEIDMASSAEEALGYLSFGMPTVIFMDHHMEGMDGLEALKIIKHNPATATIPVIMYTSQSGDVYVGQAYALGALDILSKEVVNPSNIESALARLNIFPDQHAQEVEDLDEESSTSTDSVATYSPSDITEEHIDEPEGVHHQSSSTERHPPAEKDVISSSETKAQIARLLELHGSEMRAQITESSNFVVRRLTSEIEQNNHGEATVDDVPLSVISEEARAETSKLGIVSNSLLILIFLAIGALSFQIYKYQSTVDRVRKNTNKIAVTASEQKKILEDVTDVGSSELDFENNFINPSALLKTLSWGINTDWQFFYGQQPLNEKQVMNLQNLVYRLDDAGFLGLVELDIHFGNYCLTQSDNGIISLALDNTPISDCTFHEDLLDINDDFISSAYLDLEKSSTPIINGNIEFVINVKGFSEPLSAYPDSSTSNAKQWNSIAAKNSRLAVDIEFF